MSSDLKRYTESLGYAIRIVREGSITRMVAIDLTNGVRHYAPENDLEDDDDRQQALVILAESVGADLER